MKVRMLRSIGRKDTLPRDNDNPTSLELAPKSDGSLPKEGEIVTMSQKDGERYIALGLGESVQEREAVGK